MKIKTLIFATDLCSKCNRCTIPIISIFFTIKIAEFAFFLHFTQSHVHYIRLFIYKNNFWLQKWFLKTGLSVQTTDAGAKWVASNNGTEDNALFSNRVAPPKRLYGCATRNLYYITIGFIYIFKSDSEKVSASPATNLTARLCTHKHTHTHAPQHTNNAVIAWEEEPWCRCCKYELTVKNIRRCLII